MVRAVNPTGGESKGEAPRLPEAGRYPVPGRHGRVVEREWDGDVWLAEAGPAPEGAALPRYRRHPLGFLRKSGWKLLLAYLVLAVVAVALWDSDKDAKWVSGIQLALPIVVGLATVIVMVTLVRFIGGRIGFDRIAPETRRQILKWGVISAVAGFAFAIVIELLVPKLFGGDPKSAGWSALAGPAEETGKILIPVVLWFRGRFRLPREGYLLVLASACTFGIFESVEYGLSPEGWQPSRPLLEIMHPLFTGFIAAVAWQVAWKRPSLITGAAIGAWVVAMIAHSTNDVVVLAGDAGGLLSGITLFAVIVMYLAQKHVARQLVPPDNVGRVSPRWRPVAPRRSS